MATMVLLARAGRPVRRVGRRHRHRRLNRQGALRDLGVAGSHRGDRRASPRRDAQGLRQAVQHPGDEADSGVVRELGANNLWGQLVEEHDQTPGNGREPPRDGIPSGSWPGRRSQESAWRASSAVCFSCPDRTLPALLWGAVFGVFGFFLPDLLVKNKAQHRSDAIRKALPDSIDLLTISVESGLAFDAAMAQVARNTDGPLAEEFTRVLKEIQIGSGRSDALRALSERTDVEDLQVFLNSMIQAEKLGIPIADVLRVQAGEIRLKRSQRIEEQAMKLPVKMVFPVMFCIMPCDLHRDPRPGSPEHCRRLQLVVTRIRGASDIGEANSGIRGLCQLLCSWHAHAEGRRGDPSMSPVESPIMG